MVAYLEDRGMVNHLCLAFTWRYRAQISRNVEMFFDFLFFQGSLARINVWPKTFLNLFPLTLTLTQTLTLKHKNVFAFEKQNDIVFRASVQIPFVRTGNFCWYMSEILIVLFFFSRIGRGYQHRKVCGDSFFFFHFSPNTKQNNW